MSGPDRRLAPKPMWRHAEDVADGRLTDPDTEGGETLDVCETAMTILDHVEAMIEMAKDAGLSEECVRLLAKAKQEAEDLIAEETGAISPSKRLRTH